MSTLFLIIFFEDPFIRYKNDSVETWTYSSYTSCYATCLNRVGADFFSIFRPFSYSFACFCFSLSIYFTLVRRHCGVAFISILTFGDCVEWMRRNYSIIICSSFSWLIAFFDSIYWLTFANFKFEWFYGETMRSKSFLWCEDL